MHITRIKFGAGFLLYSILTFKLSNSINSIDSLNTINSMIQGVLMNFCTNQKPFFTFMNRNQQISPMKIKKVPLYRVYSLNYLFLQFRAKWRTGCIEDNYEL